VSNACRVEQRSAWVPKQEDLAPNHKPEESILPSLTRPVPMIVSSGLLCECPTSQNPTHQPPDDSHVVSRAMAQGQVVYNPDKGGFLVVAADAHTAELRRMAGSLDLERSDEGHSGTCEAAKATEKPTRVRPM
jgi:hypothetical protein